MKRLRKRFVPVSPIYNRGKGTCWILGTSVSTVNRWKACGLLDDATLQCGKVVIFELPKVIEILRVSDKKNKFNVKS